MTEWPLLPTIAGGALMGAIVGSFLATLVLRWPRGEGGARGRSRCDHCRAPLSAAALVPLVSFLALRGRCGRCGGAIDPRHPLIELGAALIGAAALARHPDAAGIAGVLFGWALLVLAVLDIGHLWLPDRLTLPLAGMGLIAGLIGIAPNVGERAIGALAGYLLLQTVRLGYRRARGIEGMGGGDPKLFAAIGAWLGWRALPYVLFGAAMLGLLWALAAMLGGRAPAARARLPFGAMLALAAWAAWLAA